MGGMRANILTIRIIASYIKFSIQPKGVQRKGIARHIIMQKSAVERNMLINGQTARLEAMPIGVSVPKNAAVTGLVAVWAPIEAHKGLAKKGGTFLTKIFSITGDIAIIPANAKYESMKAMVFESSGKITRWIKKTALSISDDFNLLQ